MVRQSDFPDKWSCGSENKRVIVEIRIPDPPSQARALDEEVTNPYTWIEIPTTSVEQWVEKGDAAQIQRTAKVRFPTEWGENTDTVQHNSPRQLIDGFEPTNAQPFMMARIWWQDHDGRWILKHFGWIGGVGQSGDANVSKFWVYDLSELLSGVPIGTTFSSPTVQQALEDITKTTNQNTPIPISDATIMPPDTEEEFLQLASEFSQPTDGPPPFNRPLRNPPGLGDFDYESNLRQPTSNRLQGTAYYSLSRDEFLDPQDVSPTELDDAEFVGVPRDAVENFEAQIIGTGSIPIGGMDSKSFVSNHDTLLDVYRWFEDQTSANLHFLPAAESVLLVADIVPERRIFAQHEVIEQKAQEPADYQFHEPVRVIDNDALYEMKPLNTLHLRGSTGEGWLDNAVDTLQSAASDLPFVDDPPSEKYPVVKVQVPALVEAAEGVELSGEVVESNASQLDTAEREARRKLTQRLEEATEGEVILGGQPRINPFDRLDAFEVCNEHVEYEETPVQYEVESVKHEKQAGGTYQTRVKVSVWANEHTMATVRKTMVEAGGS